MMSKSTHSLYFPGLDGLRLFSAYGVVITHTAFQTGHVRNVWLDRICGRLDLAVAVFFALSGFLLWKNYSEAALSPKLTSVKKNSVFVYYLHRCARLLPAYWIVVIVAFILLPSLHNADWKVFAANKTYTKNKKPQNGAFDNRKC